MKMQTIRLPSNNALRCRALAQENAALRAAAARWAKARRLALARLLRLCTFYFCAGAFAITGKGGF